MTSSIFSSELVNFQSKLGSEESLEQAKVALKQAHDNEVGGLLLGLAAPAAKGFAARALKLGEGNLKAVFGESKPGQLLESLERTKAASEGRVIPREAIGETSSERTFGNPAFNPDDAPDESDIPEFTLDHDLGADVPASVDVDDLPAAISSADASSGDLSGVSDETLQSMLDVVNGRVAGVNSLTEQEFSFANAAREQAVQAGIAADEEPAESALAQSASRFAEGGLRGDSTIARALNLGGEGALDPDLGTEGVSEGISEGVSEGVSEAASAVSEGVSEATSAVSEGVSAGADALAATGDSLLAAGATLDLTGVGAIAGAVVGAAGAAISLYEGFKDIFDHHDPVQPPPVSQAVFEPGAISSLG